MSEDTPQLEKLPYQIIKLPDNYTLMAQAAHSSSSTASNPGQAQAASPKNTIYVLTKPQPATNTLDTSGVFKMPYPPQLTTLLKGRTVVLKQLSNAVQHVSHKAVPVVPRKRRVQSPRTSWMIKGAKRAKVERASLPLLAPAPSVLAELEKVEQPIEEKPTVKTKSQASASKSRIRRCSSDESGLRYFASKVSDKVKEKQLTTYNAVAEELAVSGTLTVTSSSERLKEKKNIRRRVYDALNVLMSIGVIKKDGSNNIAWSGNPRTLAEAIAPNDVRERSEQRRRKVIRQLRQRVFNSSLQYLALKELAEENKKRDLERDQELPNAESLKGKSEDEVRKIRSIASIITESEYDETQRIQLPFIFLTCPQNFKVEVAVDSASAEHQVAFAEPFNIVEDTEVLRRTPLVRALDSGEYTEEQLAQALNHMPSFMNPTLSELVKMHRNRVRSDTETKTRRTMEAELAASLKAAAPVPVAPMVIKKRPVTRPSWETKPSTKPPTIQKELYTTMPLQQAIAQGLTVKLVDKDNNVLTSILKK